MIDLIAMFHQKVLTSCMFYMCTLIYIIKSFKCSSSWLLITYRMTLDFLLLLDSFRFRQKKYCKWMLEFISMLELYEVWTVCKKLQTSHNLREDRYSYVCSVLILQNDWSIMSVTPDSKIIIIETPICNIKLLLFIISNENGKNYNTRHCATDHRCHDSKG